MLAINSLEVAYSAIRAVKGISLTVQQGELVCLIGANGAGKTTTIKTLAGLLSPSAGTIHFEGADINALPAHERVQRGMVVVPEGRGIFSRLTVDENIAMGAYCRRDNAAIGQDRERVLGLFPRLAERLRQQAGTLSGGEQQMLAMGRALMARPRLLLLDEPSMGLAPILVKTLFNTISQIAADGVTILLVEQNAKRALEISHRAYVMESGCIALSGASQDLLHDPAVRRAYLGE